jgi:HlyD family secretion protein
VRDALAALSTDEINLSKASITAPANGVVLTRAVDPGNAVAASLQAVTLFTVAEDLTKLRLWVYVDEADVGAVKVGQDGHLHRQCLSGAQVSGAYHACRFWLNHH